MSVSRKLSSNLALITMLFCGSAASSEPASGSAQLTRPVILTGEIQAADSQSILVPPSQSSPVVLRFFVPEATRVKKGDLILRIDGNTSGQTETALLQQIEQVGARQSKDQSNQRVMVLDAEIALLQASALFDKAKIDASVPKQYVSALDFDRYQNESSRTQADVQQKRLALDAARVAATNAKQDGVVELQSLQIDLAFARSVQSRSEVRAKFDGVVTHGYSEWRGRRIDQGESVWPGNEAGKLVAGDRRSIVAWTLEADRHFLQEQQAVRVHVDALSDRSFVSKITSISESPENRAEWGNGRYFKVLIDIDPEQTENLVPGMSVRIEPQVARSAIGNQAPQVARSAIGNQAPQVARSAIGNQAPQVARSAIGNQAPQVARSAIGNQAPQVARSAIGNQAPQVARSAVDRIEFEGEVSSKNRSAIGPPTIKDVWQYTITMLAPEGTQAKIGQPVAIFDDSPVRNKLDEKRRRLDEVGKQQAQMLLNHDELKRQGEIAVREAQANVEKSQRKASQPAGLIGRNDYQKLVVERVLAQKLLTLAVKKDRAQNRSRAAERNERATEISLLAAEIKELEAAIHQLRVAPSFEGIVIHGQGFDGEKFKTGSQIFQGLTVATVADTKALRVEAAVNESDASAVRIGQTALVRFGTAGSSLEAQVVELGSVFRRKGRSQANIVRDVVLEFSETQNLPTELKPGVAVQVSIDLPKEGT